MQSKAETVDAYLDELPEERQGPLRELRKTLAGNLPKGFVERMGYGMPGYDVPHALYPAGYHCDPKQPLPFIGFASQKNSVNLYHMGIYADPKLLAWFEKAYAALGVGKPDMGKSCIRFKNPAKIPFALIGELARKMTPQDWITLYEKKLKPVR